MKPVKIIADNRRVRYDYHIEETYEAGLVLTGTEVKSLRDGKVSLRDSYAVVEGGEVFLYNMHIAPYERGNIYNHEPKRKRKLLLNRSEISRLAGRSREKGYTMVPLKIYFKGSWAKIELALARGKRLYDRRQDIAERDAQRQIARALRSRE